ncbi:hypothetical protein MBM_07862 [Drepanopeziza brunnea f. sp. 'multigermtubi' MB_m1]|uniref:Uncharacterized protein n=1 Tax=Marssonina brunnea f. sp. multigermtubi (strain MB_m1) TaxID=1072389 RepID=K1WAC0_MARBU|nr:uncharacterized protein MBM_07862 [Drepanopeziza brunnea f. sp. 'multigermtubi' MB_m1]EKD14185.1 hypothetical protein MBM_07862 [Drepanopeziza brunnea f. sp. 'multigermtubi' MB_m1]
MADRATGPPGGESSRQGAMGLSEGPDDEMSSILFDLNELLYARLDSEITARAMGYSRIFEKLGPSSNKNGLEIIIGLDNNRGYGSYTLKEDPLKPERFGNGLLKDFGSGNELLKDLGRGRTTGNYIGNLVPIRLLAKHGTLAYGTLSAFDDDKDDFLKLRATDLHLRAKELALFARSFLKELKYSRLDDDFKT